jgi:hypothetical protein
MLLSAPCSFLCKTGKLYYVRFCLTLGINRHRHSNTHDFSNQFAKIELGFFIEKNLRFTGLRTWQMALSQGRQQYETVNPVRHVLIGKALSMEMRLIGESAARLHKNSLNVA